MTAENNSAKRTILLVHGGDFKPLDCGLAASLILAVLDGLLYQAMAGLTDIDSPELPQKISGIILEGMLR